MNSKSTWNQHDLHDFESNKKEIKEDGRGGGGGGAAKKDQRKKE